MKRFLGMAMGALMIPALAGAAIHARYRIMLRDGTQIVSKDLPVHRGSVVTFHDARSGALTGLPEEQIVRIETGAATVAEPAADVLVRGNRAVVSTPSQPMQPGDVVELGPTGGGPLLPPNGAANGAPQVQNGNGAYGQPPVGAYGGAYAPGTIGLNGQAMATPSTVAGAPPTVGPNGFPVMSGNPPTTGPNGIPISSSDQPLIGSNGTPVSPGTAGAAQPVIGSNGTPVLAPSGAPGGTAPVIGPNGTPVLAPAGSPGAAQPNTGSNGTPVAPPPGANPHK